MNWQFLAIISVLSLSVSNLLARFLMKKDDSDPIEYAIVFQLLLGAVCLIAALAFGRFAWPPISHMPLRFLLSAFMWAFSTLLAFKAARTLGAGELTIFSSSSSLFTILFGVTILGEKFGLFQVAGVAAIFIAILMVSTKLSFTSRRGILFVTLSSLCASIGVVNDSIILRSYEAFSFMAVMSLLPGLILMLMYPAKALSLKVVRNKAILKTMIVFSVIYGIQGITYYAAMQLHAPVSRLSLFSRTSTVITVLLAAVFLQEKKRLPAKLVAAVITMGGMMLISL